MLEKGVVMGAQRFPPSSIMAEANSLFSGQHFDGVDDLSVQSQRDNLSVGLHEDHLFSRDKIFFKVGQAVGVPEFSRLSGI